MKASARSKQRKKVQLLSTNNKSFTNGGRMIGSVRQDMVIHSGIADEDVRLERVRNSHHAARQGQPDANIVRILSLYDNLCSKSLCNSE